MSEVAEESEGWYRLRTVTAEWNSDEEDEPPKPSSSDLRSSMKVSCSRFSCLIACKPRLLPSSVVGYTPLINDARGGDTPLINDASGGDTPLINAASWWGYPFNASGGDTPLATLVVGVPF